MWDYLIKWLLLLVKSLPTNVHVRKINVHLFLVINVYTLYPLLTPASIPWYTINTVDPCILRSKWKWKRRTEDIFVISQCKVLGKMNGFLLDNYFLSQKANSNEDKMMLISKTVYNAIISLQGRELQSTWKQFNGCWRNRK